ncbi:Gfo/Idh/MocA family oxidoreductase [Roseomonas sp. OT10]|uniref:Gfo/Idh/MocA family protein n=1 Tax=Roseomonas cutis TaxID=2897332 RepID=UPI001E33502E|nr:Gfo/Idh/MocA family oxidoreductase [Roseomonas sp. OT10]UFN48850.1 Gfo/Idh/MocA family oxidoreductase [Roseomonas sp. OT10]
MTRHRVAVVGCGIGRNHMLEGYLPHRDRFEVVAVCDLNPERLRPFATEFGIPRAVTDFAEVLRMPDVAVVDICTPPAVHKPMMLAALEAGKQVICEKPLVGSLRDADEVIAAEARARGRVMPIFQYRWGDGVARAKAIIDAGIAGKPHLGTVETAWLRGADYYAVPWRGKWETELGGTLVTHAIHPHDLLCELMGEVGSVFAETATRVNDIQVEDCAVASLVMRSGALVALSATIGSQVQITRLRLCFENVTFESTLSPYRPGDGPWTITAAGPAVQARIDALLEGWEEVPPRFEGQMRAYAEALDSGGPLPVTLADARRSLELLTALYHSAATGSRVTLPIGPEHPRYGGWQPR